MKFLVYATVLSAALAAVLPAPAAAQSDILLRLRSGSPLGDRVRVDSAGGLIALGSIGIGIIPFSGNGSRMMWYPFKAAFRAGTIDNSSGAWDDANIGFYSFAGGLNTTATSTGAFAMGQYANADGVSSVALGHRTTADADYTVALGYRASANGHTGAMVIADASTTDSLEASANNQFNVRAAGGYRLFSNATETTGLSMNAGGSSWIVISDRNRKESFLDIDGEDVLVRLRSVPVTTWRYRDEADRTVRHIGPMAQDWARAFGFSSDDTTINMSDFDGVNLAAIQALERRTAELRAQVAERDARIETLEARLARLEALVARQAP